MTTTPPTLEAVRAALDCISSDVGHDERVRLAFAVFDDLGDAGAELWHAWAGRRSKPNAAEDRATWKSARKRGPVTAATLFGVAKDHGFRFDAVQTPAHKPTAGELKAQAAALRAADERERAAKATRESEAAVASGLSRVLSASQRRQTKGRDVAGPPREGRLQVRIDRVTASAIRRTKC